MTTMVYRSADQIISAMNRVYAWMAAAMALSLITAATAASSAALQQFLFTGITQWIVIFAPLVCVLAMSFAQQKFDRSQLQAFLMLFSVLMGLSISSIFAVFSLGSIVSAFMGTVVLFGTMSLWGYFTRRDLSGLGSFLLVGLIALIIVSVINVFIGSSMTAMIISAVAIPLFMLLTAYDTQRIREMVSVDTDGRGEIMGALSLYLNFINIFISLIQLFGHRE